MTGEQIYLMTSAELNMIAAAGGLKRFLMFEENTVPDREHQLQAVFRLVQDGFFVCGKSTIQPGKRLRPILPAMRHPDAVVVIRDALEQTPPTCLYWHSGQETLQVTPHGYREGFYEVGLRRTERLWEDLEAKGLLPALPDRRLAGPDGEDEHVARRLAGLGERWNEDKIREVFGVDLLSICEKYAPAQHTITDRLLIVQGTFAPQMVLRSSSGLKAAAYSRNGFVRWLEGANA